MGWVSAQGSWICAGAVRLGRAAHGAVSWGLLDPEHALDLAEQRAQAALAPEGFLEVAGHRLGQLPLELVEDGRQRGRGLVGGDAALLDDLGGRLRRLPGLVEGAAQQGVQLAAGLRGQFALEQAKDLQHEALGGVRRDAGLLDDEVDELLHRYSPAWETPLSPRHSHKGEPA